MITSIVFDVDDTIYDQQAPYRIAVEKCFPDFDMSKINQAYIRFPSLFRCRISACNGR